jgi:acetylglutamate kinase
LRAPGAGMSRLVVKVGGAVADRSAEAVLELAVANEVCVVHGAGPQISTEMERAGIPVEFVGGRRVTTAAGIDVVRRSFAAVNAALCAALGERAVPLFGDEIALEAEPVPELGLVGEAVPSELPAIVAALDAGLIPVVAPIARGPLNVNADSASAAIAAGIGADRLLFLTDVDGLILDGAVVDAIDVDSAEHLLASGELEGGIVPKLRAAVTAARAGVAVAIGRTEIAALPVTATRP